MTQGRSWRMRALLVSGAMLGATLVAEILVRALEPTVEKCSLHITLADRPYLYGLNPAHPEVSSQGLRDREFAIPAPLQTTRILVLGDSVVYGVDVPRDQAMPPQIARELAMPNVEVINAGVHGYTPFNELQYYLDRGRAFGADVVVVVFCLNDVVDPHLHWRYSQGLIPSIPAEAVPNHDYHANHSVAVLARQRLAQQRRTRFPLSLLRRSALFRQVSKVFEDRPERPTRVVGGREWSLRITGEDSISIDVLMDTESAEWVWLRRTYRKLAEAVHADGAEFVVASVPLAYQLDPDYPYVPQADLGAFCRELGADFVSALPALRGLPVDRVFLGESSGADDIWHFTPEGLRLIAQVIAEHLRLEVLPRLVR